VYKVAATILETDFIGGVLTADSYKSFVENNLYNLQSIIYYYEGKWFFQDRILKRVGIKCTH
jgi:hypothetical protein